MMDAGYLDLGVVLEDYLFDEGDDLDLYILNDVRYCTIDPNIHIEP